MPLDEIPSPCIDICHMSIRLGYCVGCFRTIEEIAQWSEMTNQEKLDVISKTEQRAFEI
jgi:hypothetical protein